MVFTEYAVTLEWIARVLAQRGYRDVLATIQGSTPTEEREQIRAQFTEDPTKHPVRVWSRPTPPARASTCRTTATGWSTSTSRSTRPGWSSGSAASTATARETPADLPVRARVRRLPSTRATWVPGGADRGQDRDRRRDLGSVNQVVDFEVRDHFDGDCGARPSPHGAGRRNPVINRALAGGLELNRRLTELSAPYGERKAEMHLTRRTPAGSWTPRCAHRQPPLVEDFSFAQDTDATCSPLPGLGSAWQPALRGLDTRLDPGVLRPITFDDRSRAGRHDLVHIHLGHPICSGSACPAHARSGGRLPAQPGHRRSG